MNPSRSISMGLTLVGPSNEISLAFQQDLNAMLEGELDTVIVNDIPALADALSPILESHINTIVKRRIRFWREGYVDTLQDMTKMIEADCSGDNLTKRLTADPAYQKAIQKWTTDVVGHDIALRLKSICDRYGVSEITLDSLNVMKVSSVRVDGISIDPTEDLLNILSYTVTLIAGLVMGAITPTVLAVVLTLISSVSMSIAIFLLEALLLIPGGIPILAGLAGLAAVRLVGSGMDSTKKLLTEKLQTAKLPEWVRNLLTDAKINEQLAKSDLKKSIRTSILEDDSKKRIAASVKQSLSAQIDRCAEDIKYVIESK